MDEPILGYAQFIDGVRRPVYEDGDRQFVIVDGKKVYGLFVVREKDRCDKPIIVGEAPL